MTLDIRRQAVGRFVTAGAVLLQRLHHDPVEIAAHERDEFRGLGLAVLGRCRSGPPSSIVLRRVEGRAGSFSRIVRRIASRPDLQQSLRVERRACP